MNLSFSNQLRCIASLVLLILSTVSVAQTKVVVIPLGGDEPPEVRPGSEIYTNTIGMKFSLIPSGSFVMGSPNGLGSTLSRPVNISEGGREVDERQHYVTISSPFFMQTTEVTQGQYQAVMGSNPSSFAACGANCPVENVNWFEAQDFIDELNARENRSGCNSQPNTCYSLPTESQWEYAARGATVSAFYNGDITNTIADANLDLIGWYSANSAFTTHPVAQLVANHWGLYDMSGNVREWCEDWYGSYPDGPVADPTGVSSGTTRVNRGSSFGTDARFARSANRFNTSPDTRSGLRGFRIILPQGQ